MSYSTKFLNKKVSVVIDRALGSKHPKYNFTYPINYGYLKDQMAPDGESLDAYVLGVDRPLKTFTGNCIAVIHRLDDDDDKLVVVPEGKTFSDEQIQEATLFQERFFTSKILRK